MISETHIAETKEGDDVCMSKGEDGMIVENPDVRYKSLTQEVSLFPTICLHRPVVAKGEERHGCEQDGGSL